MNSIYSSDETFSNWLADQVDRLGLTDHNRQVIMDIAANALNCAKGEISQQTWLKLLETGGSFAHGIITDTKNGLDAVMRFTSNKGTLIINIMALDDDEDTHEIYSRFWSGVQVTPGSIFFDWQEYGRLWRCEVLKGTILLEVQPARGMPGAWAAKANNISLGNWTGPDSAKKVLEEWFIEQLKGLKL